VGSEVPVINVIDPMVQLICQDFSKQNVTVIGTKLTINCGVYSARVKEKCRGVNISEMATPLLASMIEEGFINDDISATVLKRYLSRINLKETNALVMGCTHYPLLEKDLSALLPQHIRVLSAPATTASTLQSVLKENGLLNTSIGTGNIRAYVSEWTNHFERNVSTFFGENVHLDMTT
jgi:glutamate racemase